MATNETTLLYSTLGELIQKYRIDAGLSISELGRQCGIHKGIISKIELGDTKRPELITLKPIARVLQIPIAELLEYYCDVEQRPDVLLELLNEAIDLSNTQLICKIALRFLQTHYEESHKLTEQLYNFTSSLADTNIKLSLYNVIVKYARGRGMQLFLARGLLQKYLIERQDLMHLEESFRVGEEILHYVNFLSTDERITFYYRMSLHAHNIKYYQACIELGKLGHAIDSTDNELKEQVALAICNSYYRMDDIAGLEQHLNMYVEFGYRFIIERENYYRAVIHASRGNYSEAIPLLKESVEGATRNQRLHRVNYLLEVLLKINDTDSFQQILENEEKKFAFDLHTPYNFSELGKYYKRKGEFLISHNRFDEGVDAYLQAMHFFGQITARKDIMDCTQDLYTFHYERGKVVSLELLGKLRDVYNNSNKD